MPTVFQYEQVKPDYELAQRQLASLEHNKRILNFIVAFGHPSHIGLVAEDVKDVQQRVNILRVTIQRFEDLYGEAMLEAAMKEVNG